jgi:acyl-[acyl-carrier-protein]-phospholipid O-acyltransferase/long-chain-fatty-acid--[acyl-carrier-protein] ligase
VDGTSVDLKEGTVGRPIPGVGARIVNLDTGEILGTDQPGMLQIKGPNVMKGYLNRPDLTAEAIQDGWYVTGDVALIDRDGFIKITGRESRFSKIGGEMVPHIQIEETLARLLKDEEEEFLPAAVTAIPHAKKGERLIVIHRKINQTPQQLCEALAKEGLPKLYRPSPDSFFEVEKLPLLGSGKLDLKQIREIALKAFNTEDS